MVGILARLPQAFFKSLVKNKITMEEIYCIRIIIMVVSYYCFVFLVMAVRKIPVQYARRTTTGDFEQDMIGRQQTMDSIKMKMLFRCNADYFAQALCLFLGICRFETDTQTVAAFQYPFGFYTILFCFVDCNFTFFIRQLQYSTNKMADDLKAAVEVFIPGKPGVETQIFSIIFMSLIISRFIISGLIAVFPAYCWFWIVQQLGDVLRRNVVDHYGWCCNRYHSTNQFVFVE